MANTTPQAVQACHELLLWLIPQLDRFPRARRFTLGERLEGGLIEVLESLVEASYSRSKQDALRQANLRLEVVRHLWRLAHELRVVSTRRYEHGAKLMTEVGRQVGGWLRSSL
ncbi:MAG: diversity-generating retroelement protein Avd [Gammaproteobacteria bacterium]